MSAGHRECGEEGHLCSGMVRNAGYCDCALSWKANLLGNLHHKPLLNRLFNISLILEFDKWTPPPPPPPPILLYSIRKNNKKKTTAPTLQINLFYCLRYKKSNCQSLVFGLLCALEHDPEILQFDKYIDKIFNIRI